MKKDQLFLSTIAPDAAEEARRHGLGLEIAEYCTAWNIVFVLVPVIKYVCTIT